jgi:hypothetical protein
LRTFVAIVSGSGQLVCHSDNRELLREVARAMEEDLPPPVADDPSSEVVEGRRRALLKIAWEQMR